MRRLFGPQLPAHQPRLGVEQLECRAQPSVLNFTSPFGPTSDRGIGQGFLNTPSLSSVGSSSAFVLEISSFGRLSSFSEAFSPVEFIFITFTNPSASSGSQPSSPPVTSPGVGEQPGSTVGSHSPTPPATANLGPVGSITTTQNTQTTTGGLTSPSTTGTATQTSTGLGGPAGSLSPAASVLFAPGSGSSPVVNPPGTTPVGPITLFSAPGTAVVPGVGQSSVPTLPAVPYIGEYPTTQPVAPETGTVPAGDAATPRVLPATVEVAPPPHLPVLVAPPTVPPASVGNQQSAVVEVEETEVTTVAPARMEETSSRWGWIGAATAVVASAYWMVYRYWYRRWLTASRRRSALVWQGSIFSTDPLPRW
ncbi:MAG: hypothetical protein JWO38_5461 [Gemmataceae bacterium]|nr:hypothetical protein [Gemmataceae bacterium]